MNSLFKLLSLAAVVSFTLLIGQGSPLAQLDSKCVDKANNGLSKLGKTQAKENTACVKNATKGKESDPEGCLSADGKGKVAKAKSKIAGCTGDITIVKATAENAFEQEAREVAHDIFGPDLNAAGLTTVGKDDGKCATFIIQKAGDILAEKGKAFRSCKKDGMKLGTITDPASLQTACLPSGGIPDPKDKIAKRITKLGDAIGKCPAGAPALLAGGSCAGLSGGALTTCVDGWVECRICQALNAADGMGQDCDLFDNGVADGSCDATAQVKIDGELVTSGLNSPVHLTAPPLDPNDPNAPERLFVVEQAGVVRIIKDGTLLGTPFLDISVLVLSGGERGLLSMAFHPDYASNGRFFVNYTRTGDGATVVARYQVSGNPDLADAGSAAILFTVSQPFGNHNGGQLAFDPNGYLYIGMGDGGGAGDLGNLAQDDTTLLGKMLRVDVDSTDLGNYGIPPGNPFADPNDGIPDEIWAKGLRNPWRFSFDRTTGDLYIADVGQNSIEEIDFQPAASTGGENWGWRLLEGSSCFNPSSNCDPGMITTLPIHEYTHALGDSVIGGFVYRGSEMPGLEGTYFYSDNGTSFVRTFEVVGGVPQNHLNRTADVEDAGASLDFVTSFGEDAQGELYIVDGDGEIYKIVLEP